LCRYTYYQLFFRFFRGSNQHKNHFDNAILVLKSIKGRYRSDLNRRNPLGTQGEVAEEYAELIMAVWCRDFRALSPRFFKETLGLHAPQFAGSQQQDCQVEPKPSHLNF
jgi:hypothetical protein